MTRASGGHIKDLQGVPLLNPQYALGNSEGFIYLILEIQHFCFTPKNQ
jgi:hypothetical protein